MAASGTGGGGAAGLGGSGGAGAPTGGVSTGGATAGGGGEMAGASGAGAVGGAAGTGGTAGAAGTGGGAMAMPSAGCAKGNPRPPNGVVTVANEHIYTFPASYDGATPMPLMLGFHANGNPINQIQNLTNGSALETGFVRAFPKSAGSGWVYNTDITRVRAMWDDLLANYCVDTSKVFGTGHSSGAQMVVQMLCNGETRFKGVAPVAASRYCNSHAAVAVMYIQGQMDAQRGNGDGADVVQIFRTSNSCQSTSVPKTDVAMCRSTFDNMQVNPGCITYDGCSVPTHWCSHNDNGYNSTDGRQHGWPCFASSAMAAFFQSLR
jgi:poly(3-hydroxybutyrate) depolymerase